MAHLDFGMRDSPIVREEIRSQLIGMLLELSPKFSKGHKGARSEVPSLYGTRMVSCGNPRSWSLLSLIQLVKNPVDNFPAYIPIEKLFVSLPGGARHPFVKLFVPSDL